jgi:hypothetical protein
MSFNLPKIATPRSLWVAAFWLDLIAEAVHGYVFRLWEVLVFFILSTAVVAIIWYFERQIKKRR